MTGGKQCTTCKEDKSLIDFVKDKSSKDGHEYRCRECSKIRGKLYRQKNREKIKQRCHNRYWGKNQDFRKKNILNSRKSGIQKNYNISYEDYKEMIKEQNGVCAICGNKETTKTKGTLRMLSIDHNHVTNKVRGLLCTRCNRALGMFEDDIDVLVSAISYLENEKYLERRTA